MQTCSLCYRGRVGNPSARREDIWRVARLFHSFLNSALGRGKWSILLQNQEVLYSIQWGGCCMSINVRLFYAIQWEAVVCHSVEAVVCHSVEAVVCHSVGGCCMSFSGRLLYVIQWDAVVCHSASLTFGTDKVLLFCRESKHDSLTVYCLGLQAS
jgi:hypothetical protein